MPFSGEAVRMACLVCVLCMSLLLMVICAYHFIVLKRIYRAQDIRKIRQVVQKAKVALQCGKLSAVEIAVLASQAGMTLEQVEEEYRKDSLTRRDVLMSVLGDSKNPFVRKFIQHYPSRFLSSGYDLEREFLHRSRSHRGADSREHRT
ncbi:hypothetical protein V3C99_011348 [Haemonchus contortus]